MNHRYIYSARAREVAAKQANLSSYVNKTFFLLAMLAIVIFATDSEAHAHSKNYFPVSLGSSVIASGAYIASHYAYNHYRRPYSYHRGYRSRNRYYHPRYRSRYYNRHYNKRYYNRHGYGNSYRYRRHY